MNCNINSSSYQNTNYIPTTVLLHIIIHKAKHNHRQYEPECEMWQSNWYTTLCSHEITKKGPRPQHTNTTGWQWIWPDQLSQEIYRGMECFLHSVLIRNLQDLLVTLSASKEKKKKEMLVYCPWTILKQ